MLKKLFHAVHLQPLKRSGGFTLIELMITVSVLAVGIVTVQGTFLRFADLLSRYSNTLSTRHWMHEKLWETREALLNGDYGGERQTGVFTENFRSFYWSMDCRNAEGAKDIFHAELTVGWQQGGSFVQLKKHAYLSA